MKRSEFIANRLREVLLNGYWIANTNYKEQLLSITWQQAVHQIADLNTIAALTYHINYYLAGLLNVFKGGLLEIKDQYSFDLPPIQSETDWKKLVEEFLVNSASFANEVAQMRDEKLDQVFIDEKYGTYLRNVEGVIEHSYYHLGQLVLIKKLIFAAGK
ncbi:DinB family protein [Pedobacter psychrodurus]|uniref:DinB family protein n=1 Tax=Pedobacter psychrodurus TaxID=2530456 RepID=A0A4R0PYD6_9SPHI|nr:DinB family protein [Pedobacter psychrodurus]TCD28110.1 DinB family protein [Pedobacter psychrodurus]